MTLCTRLSQTGNSYTQLVETVLSENTRSHQYHSDTLEWIHVGISQGSHRLEKYLNIHVQDCLEKCLKIKFALKST